MGGTRCAAMKDDGSPCQATRMHGSAFCFFHDPEKAAERAVAQRTGGRRGRAAVLPAETPACRVRGPQDVTELLSETINQVRTGVLDPRVGNCIGYLAGIVLKAVDQGEFAARLAALEAAVKGQPAGQRVFEAEPDELVVDSEPLMLPQGTPE